MDTQRKEKGRRKRGGERGGKKRGEGRKEETNLSNLCDTGASRGLRSLLGDVGVESKPR